MSKVSNADGPRPLKVKLTKRAIDAIAPGTVESFHWDLEQRGLGIRVKPSGVKTWFIQYRTGNGRTRRLSLGTVLELTPEQARRLAQEKLLQVKSGKDPSAERKAERQAETVAEMLGRFRNDHVNIHCRPKTIAEYGRLINKVIVPGIGALVAKSVDRTDVERFHRKLASTPRQANHALAVLMAAFTFSRGPDAANPCRGVKKYPEIHRERFLSHGELRRLGACLASMEEEGVLYLPALRAVRLLVLTGLRLSEATGLTWADFSAERSAVHLPRPKGRKGPEWRVIGADAMELLKAMPRRDNVMWIFPNRAGDGPLQKEAMEKTWQKIRERCRLQDARLHDLRHTVGTMAGRTGVSSFIVRDLLGHRTIAMTNRYVNHDVDPVKSLSNQVASTIAMHLDGNVEVNAESGGGKEPRE